MADISPEEWAKIRNGIFAGESGGDYNALFGYSNRPGGKFSQKPLTSMTVDEALAFADPSGPYGQWVKGQVGRVATPMGAYQVVGTTLKAAKQALGLTGTEVLDQATQDRIGQWILANQGTGAWEGYRGPRDEFTPSNTGGPASDYAGGAVAGTYAPQDGSIPQAPPGPPNPNNALNQPKLNVAIAGNDVNNFLRQPTMAQYQPLQYERRNILGGV